MECNQLKERINEWRQGHCENRCDSNKAAQFSSGTLRQSEPG